MEGLKGPVFGTNPILRNLRLPTKVFSRGVVFTPYGKKLNAAR